MTHKTGRIAAYWDFENVHAAAVNAERGEGAYAKYHGNQPCLLELDPVVQHMRSLGEIVVHRAYGNWHNLWRYARALQQHAIDLVQMFPLTEKSKNAADIRMVLDAMHDVMRYPYITHVVIIGGDSDFVPLAQALRQAGKNVVGIAFSESTNVFWRRACHFIPYRSLLQAWHARARNNGRQVPARIVPAQAPVAANQSGENLERDRQRRTA